MSYPKSEQAERAAQTSLGGTPPERVSKASSAVSNSNPSPWQPEPVKLDRLSNPKSYSGSGVHHAQQESARIVNATMRAADLRSIAAAYIRDTEEFDNFIFTGPRDPGKGTRPRDGREDTASVVFSHRRFELAAWQAKALRFSEEELRREIHAAERAYQESKYLGGIQPQHLFFRAD